MPRSYPILAAYLDISIPVDSLNGKSGLLSSIRPRSLIPPSQRHQPTQKSHGLHNHHRALSPRTPASRPTPVAARDEHPQDDLVFDLLPLIPPAPSLPHHPEFLRGQPPHEPTNMAMIVIYLDSAEPARV